MLNESIIFLLLAFLILVLLVFGFETVGFTLSEALLIFIGSTLLFLASFPSSLLYFRVLLVVGVLLFRGFLIVGPRNELAIGFDLAGFLIPFLISLKMMIDHRSPIRASIIGVSVIAVFNDRNSNDACSNR